MWRCEGGPFRDAHPLESVKRPAGANGDSRRSNGGLVTALRGKRSNADFFSLHKL